MLGTTEVVCVRVAQYNKGNLQGWIKGKPVSEMGLETELLHS